MGAPPKKTDNNERRGQARREKESEKRRERVPRGKRKVVKALRSPSPDTTTVIHTTQCSKCEDISGKEHTRRNSKRITQRRESEEKKKRDTRSGRNGTGKNYVEDARQQSLGFFLPPKKQNKKEHNIALRSIPSRRSKEHTR